MNSQFHRNLNRMSLFMALALAGLVLCYAEFLRIAMSNIWLNGAIIGVTIFGVGLCFVDMFKLLPEYRWLKRYFCGNCNAPLPPRVLRPVAMMLQGKNQRISPTTVHSFLDIILGRFEDQRESVRYITNTLIFLGLLGTFWGLIHTIGGFADMVGGLNFDDENIMTALQVGLSRPLMGMGIAFTSSLFGLAGSLVVGFLGLQVQLAQSAIFRELEENLSSITALPSVVIKPDPISTVAQDLVKAVQNLENTVARLRKK